MTASSTDLPVTPGDSPALSTASSATSPKASPDRRAITPFEMGPPEVPLPKQNPPEVLPQKQNSSLAMDPAETPLIKTTSLQATATQEATPMEITSPATPSETIPTHAAPTEASIVSEFFTLPDHKFPKQFHLAFDDYLYRPQPDESLDHAKVTQVLESMLRLRWIYNDTYRLLVKDQPANSILQHESFKWMHELLVEYCRNPHHQKLLIILILIRAGEDISSSDRHEEIFQKFTGSDCIPSIANHDHAKAVLRSWLLLASQLNLRELEHAVAPPACLEILADPEGPKDAFLSHFISNWAYTKALNEPAYQSMRDVYDSVTALVSNPTQTSASAAYDLILKRKESRLGEVISALELHNLQKDTYSAFLRLLFMGNVTDVETAKMFDEATMALGKKGPKFVQFLNRSGSLSHPAVQVTNITAVFELVAKKRTKVVVKTGSNYVAKMGSKHVAKQAASDTYLTDLLVYLFQVMDLNEIPDGCIVVERDVTELINVLIDGNFGGGWALPKVRALVRKPNVSAL